jgi:hypothetical protein
LSVIPNFAAILTNFSHDDRHNHPAAPMEVAEGGKNTTFFTSHTHNGNGWRNSMVIPKSTNKVEKKYMNGYRIVTNRIIKENERSFKLLFKSIFPRISTMWSLFRVNSFLWPAEWEDNSEYDNLLRKYISGPMKKFSDITTMFSYKDMNYYYGEPGVIPLFADYLNEDWNLLITFDKPLQDPELWICELDKVDNKTDFIGKSIETCFINLDGSVWEIYTNNLADLEIIKKNLNSVREISFSEQDFEYSDVFESLLKSGY